MRRMMGKSVREQDCLAIALCFMVLLVCLMFIMLAVYIGRTYGIAV